MFDYLCGKVSGAGENRLVIDCGGVGFTVNATSSAVSAFANEKEAKVPVYLAVREDALELFGFASQTERDIFLLLIGVSGVGARLAVTLLSGLDASRIASAVASSDIGVLASVKGVGKKTAERIVLELKGKISDIVPTSGVRATPSAALNEDAILMLIGLGMDRREAEATVNRVQKPGMTTEDVVRAALRG